MRREGKAGVWYRFSNFRYWGLLIGSSSLIIWVVWAIFQQKISEAFGYPSGLSDLGQFGDSFGVLNALFAAFGFLAVVLTLTSQQKQIKYAQEDQHRQRFEASYYELIRLLEKSRNNLKYTHTTEYYNHAKNNINNQMKRLSFSKESTGVDTFKSAWMEAIYYVRMKGARPTKEVVAAYYVIHIHDRNETTFSPYFRLIYTILNRIKNDKVLSNEERVQYANLLRSQLTSYELAICALNGLSEVSNDFDKLLIEFRFLKYIPRGFRRSFLSSYYPEEAFLPRV